MNSRPLCTIIFKLKNDNFKTRDFSPLIKRVITGVCLVLLFAKIILDQLLWIGAKYQNFAYRPMSKTFELIGGQAEILAEMVV